MTIQNPDMDELKEILEKSNTIAVVGLSNNPERTSYQIAKIMQENGYRIIPVNPKVREVLGEKAYPNLTDIDIPFDIINVFRRSEFLPDIAREAVQTDAKIFWAQQGIKNEEAFSYLKEHEFTVIMDACIKVVHAVTIGK
ncbi:Predicted CoA-binding protein [Salinibacillus kushneri]|uniref:Predicted CoA-binding protein n=1 Tax=Salinibacillus kushneri TaxID=237682 RepID=A0A1I0E1J7_9BACI|nr:CoA-binding protein [Salinibacillus kushneri]SET38042.1 Predicted CoA-binding protein [Salinibacillus kushneri]